MDRSDIACADREVLLEPALEVGQLGTRVLLPRKRLGEIPTERGQLGLGEVGQLDGLGRGRQLRRVGRLRLGRRLLRLATFFSWARRPVPNPCSVSCSAAAI